MSGKERAFTSSRRWSEPTAGRHTAQEPHVLEFVFNLKVNQLPQELLAHLWKGQQLYSIFTVLCAPEPSSGDLRVGEIGEKM